MRAYIASNVVYIYYTCYIGVGEFTAFRASIGEALVFFGTIELFVFIRTFHIEDGSVRPLNDSVKCVKTGINLFVDRAPNKGPYHAACLAHPVICMYTTDFLQFLFESQSPH